MSNSSDVDYGPLAALMGVWEGDKGMDVAPDPEGLEHNPYRESITFSGIGHVANAGAQKLAVLHYRQLVRHQSNGEIFHDQTGYWMWDADAEIVMHAFVIPRGVSVMAGGKFDGAKKEGDCLTLEVSASAENSDWKLVQSPFMHGHAETTSFCQRITVDDEKLSYMQTTVVDIYGRLVEHTDENQLIRL